MRDIVFAALLVLAGCQQAPVTTPPSMPAHRLQQEPAKRIDADSLDDSLRKVQQRLRKLQFERELSPGGIR